MPQDAITLSRMAIELNDLFSGAKVNKVNQPGQDEIVLSVYSKYGNAKISVCANPLSARVGITELERQNPAIPPAFCMLLRKHLSNASIKSICDIENERIIRIVFNGKNDFMEPVEKQLYCEIMGKYSNAVFCENEIILGTLRPVSFDFGKERALLNGAKYNLPRTQDKISIFSENCLSVLKNFNGGDFADFLFRNVVGLSSFTAKEVVFRLFGKTIFDSPLANLEQVIEQIIDFLKNYQNKPTVVFLDDKPADYFFCDYLTVSGKKKFFDCITAAETFFFDEKKKLREKTELKNKLTSVVTSVIKKEKKKLAIINDKLLSCEDAEKYRQYGELLTANIYKIKRGDKLVTVIDYYNENEELSISLDTTLSPNQNAQKYFKRYTKLKNTVKAVTPQKEQVKIELNYAESVLAEIQAADDTTSLNYIKEELIEGGYIELKDKTPKKKGEKALSEFRNFEYSGFKIRAGKNNIQNDKLTFSAKPADCWLHVKDYHSAHVVIESSGKHIPLDIIGIAAEICAYYSEAKNGDKVAVDYTLRKYVKKPPKSKFGSVVYTDFKTLFVTPNQHSNIEIK